MAMFSLEKTLKDYIDSCNETEIKIIEAEHSFFRIICDMDRFYREELVKGDFDLCPASHFLAFNSYSLMLSGIKTVLTGHAFAVYPIFRTSLESIIYACYINESEELQTIWLDRNKNDSSKKKCREAFKIKKMIKDIRSHLPTEHENIGYMISEIYEASIDFGAHPNVRGIVEQLSNGEEYGDHWKFDMTALYGERDFQVKRSMLACLEYFFIILYITALLLKKNKDSFILDKLSDFDAQKEEWGN
ncbi:hypothetical protein [Pectobacterium versatile]|uniref:hypothetical protein n=1 Tax=Pectobacterium versatile TaxID=2488639 RepID=UPI002B23FEAB|nr:hypothetical protein [Pectobacterium versatile]